MRFLPFILLVYCSFVQAMDIKFDCYLPRLPGDCREVQTAYFESVSFLQNVEDAKLRIDVRGVRVQSGVRYTFSFAGPTTKFTLEDRIPSTLGKSERLVRLLSNLQRGSAAFLQSDGGQTEAGVLILRLRDPIAANVAVARKDSGSSHFYFNPSISGNFSQNTLTKYNVRSFGVLNYSHPDWRVRQDFFGGWEYIDDDDPSTEPFVSTFLGGYGFAARSLPNGFQLATSLLLAHDSRDNQLYVLRNRVGVEWLLHPFLESNTSNFGFRYQLGVEHVSFLEENILGHMSEDFLMHQASSFVSWHIGSVDVEFRAKFQSIVDDLTFSSVEGDGDLTWRLTDALSIGLNGRAAYRNQLINAPKEESDDALAQIFGGNFGDVTYRGQLRLSYVIGNALLHRQDRRWR